MYSNTLTMIQWVYVLFVTVERTIEVQTCRNRV